MKPMRVQLSRRKGWRMPENTVKVSRGTLWGNPFNDTQVGVAIGAWGLPFPIVQLHTQPSRARCLDMYVAWLYGMLQVNPRFLERLRGKHSACWCAATEPCHADILLRLSNFASDDV